MRFVLSDLFNSQPDIEVVGTAQDGLEALQLIEQTNPDVISLDIEMPRMDGLTMLEKLMAERPTPVVMFSSYTQEGSRFTLKALELGAVDFVPKPLGRLALTLAHVKKELIEKVRTAAAVDHRKLKNRVVRQVVSKNARPGKKKDWLKEAGNELKKIVVIGSSTGGPSALATLFTEIPADLPAGFIVVQHMPAGFTKSLAERLDSLSPMRVKEAEEKDRLRPGLVLVAPGDYHLQVGRLGVIHLFWGPRVCGVRPAADITMESVARVYKEKAIAIVLTGMGVDGTRGASAIKEAGGSTIAEHESSCIVYGMPAALVEAGKADQVLPIQAIARALIQELED